MSNPNNQKSQEPKAKNKPNFAPEALQGTDDTQSEFSVSAAREERREEDKKADDQSANTASNKESNTAETQSEFSVNERLQGNS